MMPVPSHLVGIVVPKEGLIDEGPLDAWVRCPCGEDRFVFLYPGATRAYEGRHYPCTTKANGGWFFLIRCRCLTCGRDHLLLDVEFHGWNGWVCHNPAQADRPRPPLVPWRCVSCGGEPHRGSV
jgi:hypothetical protein